MGTIVDFIFGSSKTTKLGRLDVDCAVSETHNASNDITENPVESGFTVTDHIQQKPKTFSLQGLISDTPVTVLGNVGTQIQGLFSDTPVTSNVTNALNFFSEILDSPTLIDIVSPLRTYNNMALQDLSIPRNKDTGQALSFTVTFKEVRVVETSEIKLAAKAKKSLGKVSPKKPADGVTDKPASLMKGFLNSIGAATPGSGV